MPKRLTLFTFLLVVTIVYSCKKNEVNTPPPVSPSLLIGTPISTSAIKLEWTDNSTTETGFKIERKLVSGVYAAIGQTSENITTYTDTGLTTGTSYSYRVFAFNDGGNSPTYTNEITLEPQPLCNSFAGNTVAPASEETMVVNYITSNGFPAVELNNSGLYYHIEVPGNAKKPTQCNSITVRYVAKLTNGTIFDQTTGNNTANFPMSAIFEGLKRSYPLIGEGGKIKLYIPPALAYGSTGAYNPNTGQYIVPPNSVVIFETELVSVF